MQQKKKKSRTKSKRKRTDTKLKSKRKHITRMVELAVACSSLSVGMDELALQ